MHAKKYIVGNWKMYGHSEMARSLVQSVVSGTASLSPDIAVVVCPPATLMAQVSGLIAGSKVAMGGQDCAEAPEGAFTGDMSAQMLKEAGCRYVIIGHSERRNHHKETSEIANKKAAAALAVGLTPIICIGETLAEREAGRAFEVVEKQVKDSIPANTSHQPPATSHFLLAYEPVWAIGSGKTPTSEDIRAMHAHIRAIAGNADVLYGGSVKASNAKEILAIEGVSGVLVGGASLKAEEFCKIMAS